MAFKLCVTAPVAVECDFWVENDGWIGTAEQLGITVHAGSFENAKRKMEDALAQSCTRAEDCMIGRIPVQQQGKRMLEGAGSAGIARSIAAQTAIPLASAIIGYD